MKRVIAITAAVVVACSYVASAQSSTTKPLADVAKAEEERRKTVKKPAKVYTNTDLKPDTTKPVPPPAPAPSATPASGNTSANASAATPGAATPAAEVKDQAYWSGRMSRARTGLDRSRIFADSLQSRLNALQTDFINRDNPVERAKIEGDRKAALAELERVKKEIETYTKELAAIEDEARRASVPPAWLRPPS